MGVKILDLNNVETQSLPDYSDLNQRWRTGNKITIPKKVLEDKGTKGLLQSVIVLIFLDFFKNLKVFDSL